MPELPDIVVYLAALESRVVGRVLERVRIRNPFVLRSVDPPLSIVEGKRVDAIRRMGKRIVFGLEGELYLVLHLMIAGRLKWREAGAKLPGRAGLAAFDFPNGTLILTEAGTKRRAALHVTQGTDGLTRFERGGLEVLDAELSEFRARLTAENRTLKRALTDPQLFSGIGNAYSDEILHRAGLSPVSLSRSLKSEEIARLHQATQATLREWIARLSDETGDAFPEKVTAFRSEMAVHGRFGKPCPACGTAVQRIRYAENETNYCPRCQTGGRLLKDRSLSRLLKDDWPRRIEDIE
jgi:formamidopyrimidine-DNA glycosylase